jgi:hypothetical protein
MKRSIGIIAVILFVAALVPPVWAHPGNGKGKGPGGGGSGGGGGGEPQAGGLPALEDRVEADEALIAALQSAVSTLQGEVTTLQGEVSGLESAVTALQGQVATLQGQNNFAVVTSACVVVSSSSSAGPVTATPVVAGECEVTFSENVSACSAQATLNNAFGEISVVSTTKSAVGDSYDVFTDVPAGTPAAAAFNLTVTCP